MSKPFDFKNIKILKPITIITLLYSALMFLKYLGGLTGLLFKSKSPLLPKYLSYYIAFPSYFILPFFLILIFLCIHSIKTKKYNFKIVYLLFGLALFVYFFEVYIYQLIMSFNPYG
jgi:hypothetical protein